VGIRLLGGAFLKGRPPACDSLARLRESILDADMWSAGSYRNSAAARKKNCDGGEQGLCIVVANRNWATLQDRRCPKTVSKQIYDRKNHKRADPDMLVNKPSPVRWRLASPKLEILGSVKCPPPDNDAYRLHNSSTGGGTNSSSPPPPQLFNDSTSGAQLGYLRKKKDGDLESLSF
jgi:hypothetical protein